MVDKINVLLIEDDPIDVGAVQEMLKDSADIEINLIITTNLAQGLKQLANDHIHVILLDLNLPDSKGIHTYIEFRKAAAKTPIIIMSGLTDKELIYQALQQGAIDYLIKGNMESESLMRAILYAIWSREKDTQ